MHYAAIQVNRPSGISQAAAISVNRTQGGINRFIIRDEGLPDYKLPILLSESLLDVKLGKPGTNHSETNNVWNALFSEKTRTNKNTFQKVAGRTCK